MNLSLSAKASLAVTLIILVISTVSTVLFISAHKRSKEQGRLVRGSALSYALAKSAEEGLLREDLNLIKKSSRVIHAPDVTLVQVFSNIWSPVDAYPFDRLPEAPAPAAIEHFNVSEGSFAVATGDGYDFYEPIQYRVGPESPAVTIGYVRLMLSSAAIRQEIRRIAALNISLASVITFIAIALINAFVGRLVIRPVMNLHRSVAAFRTGALDPHSLPLPASPDEVGDLAREFRQLMITVREREQQLRESDRRIRSLFERVEHAIFRTDRDGAVIEANERFRGLFGTVSGLCDILIGDRGAADCLRTAAANSGLHIEDRALGRDGAELFVAFSLYPIRDDAGQVTGFDGYLIDVTEKKRLEERLMRSQKLEAVGTLAGGMAHDFNNLLTAILGYSGIMLKSLKEDDPLYKPAQVIHNAATRGAAFGRKILALTRKEKLETRPVDVNDVVRSALELLERSMPRNIEISVHLQNDLPVTSADPAQIQQVVINLAVNARDAMPDGGKLVIETALTDVRGEDADSFIRLSVSDTGMGIDAKTQDRIFDPFFTTKDVGKGTGLGLYIVQSIVSKHNGYINLYSEPGRGSRFNVYFPVVRSHAGDASLLPSDLRGSGTVLVIDDEPDICELCRDILAPLGYTVLTAESGAAGVNLYRERKQDIFLVILDMIMPKMDGAEVFQALKSINPAVQVLLYSGYSSRSFAGIDELITRGAIGLLQKPFTNLELAIMVKKAASAEASDARETAR